MDPSKAWITDTFEHIFLKFIRFVYLLESRGDSNKYPGRMFSYRITWDCQRKYTRSADFCADRIDVITNFAVITNVVIKRVHMKLHCYNVWWHQNKFIQRLKTTVVIISLWFIKKSLSSIWWVSNFDDMSKLSFLSSHPGPGCSKHR